MAKSSAKKVGEKTLKEVVQEQVEELKQEEQEKVFPEDEEFVLSADPSTGRLRKVKMGLAAPKDPAEIVIDELLASVPRGQGFYLKLYKERAPNEFELKQRIDNFESWSDMELEITNIVRAYTAKSPQLAHKWGSGRYRVIIWREGGLRGTKYKPLDFSVDAQEPEHMINANGKGDGNGTTVIDPSSQLESLTTLLEVVKKISPSTPPDQAQKMIAEAYQAGASAKNQEQQSLTAILSTVLTALLGRQQQSQGQPDLGALITSLAIALKPQQQQQPQDPIETLVKLKQAGLLPDQKPANDVTQSLELVKTLIPVLSSSLGGGGSEPSITGKLIETLGPQVGKMVTEITDAIKQVVAARTARPIVVPTLPAPNSTPQRQPQQITPGSQTPGMRSAGAPDVIYNPAPANDINNNGGTNGTPMLPIFKVVKEAIETNNTNFFPSLRDLLLRATSEDEYEQIIAGQVPIDQLLSQVATYGGNFFLSDAARNYINTFIQWELAERAKGIIAKCEKCNDDYSFASQDEFDEDHACPQCGSELLLIQASQA